jgi:CRISPR-associated endonuclease/helicase Cas3
MSKSFCAHSHEGLPVERWHGLKQHLEAVGATAAVSAEKFGAANLGRATGLLHDLGKYSGEFQAKLRGANRRVDHSTAGAKIAFERFGSIGRLLACAIAGHHAGLANGTGAGERTPVAERLALHFGADLPAIDGAWQDEILLPERLSLPRLGWHPDPRMAEKRNGFRAAFLARMLFSCLVDADYLDTETWYASIERRPIERGNWPSIAVLKAALDQHLAEKSAKAKLTEVNGLRADVLRAARAAAEMNPGMFSLTVPTGGGKTLSGLAFALDHAVRWLRDRVIYVAPFTSVIEQNAAVFRDALVPFGDAVLEHHSAFRDEELLRESRRDQGEKGPEARDKLKLAMENWDAPIIATTAVQFFESLFAATPAKCRKLHNIARSVVILDEAQTLPLKFLQPCIAAIDELARNYAASVVLCTATQPAIKEHPEDPERSFRGGLRDVREIAPDRDALFRRLKRVAITKVDDELDDETLAERLREHEQVLCIVNTRAHARAVFEAIRISPGARHLSTWMCATHRAKVLGEIRDDLAAGRPCRVVSTSLVEAGVDVDFPCVFRAEAGLDSIAQAAGRCNREGNRRPEESPVYLFRPVGWPTPCEIEQFAGAMRGILRRYRDVLAPAAVEAYFREVYWLRSSGRDNQLDDKNILGLLQERCGDFWFPFEDVAKLFRIIEDAQQPILIPYDDLARRNIEALQHAERVGGIARKLQPYVVPVHSGIFERLFKAGAIAPARDDAAGRQFFTLLNPDLYREDVGLASDDPEFMRADRLVA